MHFLKSVNLNVGCFSSRLKLAQKYVLVKNGLTSISQRRAGMQKFEALIFSPQTEHIGVHLNLALSLELKAVNINWLNDMTS